MRVKGLGLRVQGRRGFSLIELIFVIVILGVLLSIAMPQFSATRDDASSTANASNISNAVKSISQYYVAKGRFETNATVMSSFITTANGWSGISLSTGTSWNGCIKLQSTSNGLSVTHENNATTACLNMKSLIKEQDIKLSGRGIEL
jgi:prepilin-type N-terminal cleavage/methylation domain-containing protein